MTTVSKSKVFLVEQPMSRQLGTVAIGLVGGLALTFLGVPAGAMSGSLIAVAIMGSLRPATIVPLGRSLRLIAMLVSGVSIGAAVTPETLRNVATYPASVTAMMACVFVMTAISTYMCEKFAGWNRSTALLASVPGALAYILSIITTTNANTPRVVAVQMMRVLFLMAFVPVLVAESGVHLALSSGRPDDSWIMFALECAAGAGIGFVLMRLKAAGGMMLGAMSVSALAHGFEFADGRAPQLALIAGQVLIGAWSGSRFAGFDWGLFLRQSPIIVGSIGLTVVVAGAFAAVISTTLGLPFGATFMAFAPGGFEAMAILALALGFDPFYVAAHHLARFFLLNFGMPVVVRLFLQKKD